MVGTPDLLGAQTSASHRVDQSEPVGAERKAGGCTCWVGLSQGLSDDKGDDIVVSAAQSGEPPQRSTERLGPQPFLHFVLGCMATRGLCKCL